MSKIAITFKPKQLTKALLSSVSGRAQDIVEKRFGLRPGYERMTLEAIGNSYGITRERVRQIESFAISTIRRAPAYVEAEAAFQEIEKLIEAYGRFVREDAFLATLSSDEHVQNHINFYLVLGGQFTRLKEDDSFHHRWTTDVRHARMVESALGHLHTKLSHDEVLSEAEMLERFHTHLVAEVGNAIDNEQAASWLGLSKAVGRNPLGGWGVASSPNIKIRGMRDMAYLVIREHGSPMHFREVARAIAGAFDRSAHEATCHNELIKDERFVLVGRGLYALASWGYARGTVRDVVMHILKSEGPLTKEDIVARVLKERYVKENTISVNLQNSSLFKRDSEGRYSLA